MSSSASSGDASPTRSLPADGSVVKMKVRTPRRAYKQVGIVPGLPPGGGGAPDRRKDRAPPQTRALAPPQGLPFKASAEDVTKFFSGFTLSPGSVYLRRHADGRLNGEVSASLLVSRTLPVLPAAGRGRRRGLGAAPGRGGLAF